MFHLTFFFGGYHCVCSDGEKTTSIQPRFGFPRLESPTLPPTMQMWSLAIFVQQKEAVEVAGWKLGSKEVRIPVG